MVSVIVPVYNSEKTLDRCIQSLLARSLEDCEFIFVNDGSRDGSLELLRKYSEKFPQIIVLNKENGGVSSARNLGLSRANGDFIAFMDSDDYYLSPSYLKNMFDTMKSSNADIAISGYTLVSQNRTELVSIKEEIKSAEQLSRKLLELQDITNSVWNKFFRRNLIIEKFDEGMNFGEDAVFVYNYLSKCQTVACCNDNSYAYVFEYTSTTSDFRKNVLYDVKQMNKYHGAILNLWSLTLQDHEEVLGLYIKLRINDLMKISRKIISNRGIVQYFSHKYDELLPDAYLKSNSERIKNADVDKYYIRIAKLLLKKKVFAIKISFLLHILRDRIFSNSNKK